MTKSSISLRDIYDVVNRLEDKMDRRMEEVEKRVDLLEDFKGRALGILGVVSFVGSAVFSWLWGKITNQS